MKAQDFFTQTDFEAAKIKLDNRQPFELTGKVGSQEITFEGKSIRPELAKNIWNGVEYLLSINEMCHDGGGGYATTDYSCFDNWEAFLKKIDDTLRSRKGYVRQDACDVQMSLF